MGNKNDANLRKKELTTYILDTIKKIENKVNNYGKNETINWAHVGSLGHVLEELENINTFLN